MVDEKKDKHLLQEMVDGICNRRLALIKTHGIPYLGDHTANDWVASIIEHLGNCPNNRKKKMTMEEYIAFAEAMGNIAALALTVLEILELRESLGDGHKPPRL